MGCKFCYTVAPCGCDELSPIEKIEQIVDAMDRDLIPVVNINKKIIPVIPLIRIGGIKNFAIFTCGNIVLMKNGDRTIYTSETNSGIVLTTGDFEDLKFAEKRFLMTLLQQTLGVR